VVEEQPEFVVVGMDSRFYERLAQATAAHPGRARFIGTTPIAPFRRSGGCAGAGRCWLSWNGNRRSADGHRQAGDGVLIEQRWPGPPAPERQQRGRLGDRLETDILGGQRPAGNCAGAERSHRRRDPWPVGYPA